MPRNKKQTRRGKGEGSIYQKNGKWYGLVTLGYNSQGKQVRKSFHGTTREEVARMVTAAASQAFEGELVVPVAENNSTVEDLMTTFLWAFKRPTVSDVTFEWYRNIAETHIIQPLGSIVAKELTPHVIQAHINSMHKRAGLDVRTIKAMRDTLNQAYNHAIEMKQATINPVSGTKLPKQSRILSEEKDINKVIPVNVRTEILNAVESDIRMKTAITVLMFTGMRIGEWLALTWGQVDFQSSTITIDRAISLTCEYDDEGKLKGRKTVVGDTKTICSMRKMKVSAVVMEVLSEWRKVLPSHVKKSVKHDVLSAKSVVFPNEMGEMRTYNGFRSTYRRFMAKMNLESYNLHSYRHTFATMLLEKGVNPKVVQKLLGHSDIQTTLGVYSHVLPEVLDGAAKVVGEIHVGMTSESKKAIQHFEQQEIA